MTALFGWTTEQLATYAFLLAALAIFLQVAVYIYKMPRLSLRIDTETRTKISTTVSVRVWNKGWRAAPVHVYNVGRKKGVDGPEAKLRWINAGADFVDGNFWVQPKSVGETYIRVAPRTDAEVPDTLIGRFDDDSLWYTIEVTVRYMPFPFLPLARVLRGTLPVALVNEAEASGHI